ncbi:MAG: cupin domain-containing protein [Pyrinomonadaceae bacterium]
MKQKIKRIFLLALSLIFGYFGIGIILNSYVFPEKKPDLSNYFQTGDKFYSKAEGFDQHILWQKDGWVRLSLVIDPKGLGPPEHIHTNLDETFTVKEGVFSILVNGEKKVLHKGESITVKSGTRHRPFNETDSPVISESTEDERSIPVEFAYHLSQLYPFADSLGENPSSFALILQLSVYGNEMDAYLADGGPIAVQKAMRFLLAPTARLLGYKSYYEEFRIKHQR